MGLADTISERDVDSPEVFAQWVQQVTGSPSPNVKNMAILRRHIKLFFKENPTWDYRVLCRTVIWANNKKRRYAHVWYYISQVKWAFAAGALSDLTDQQAQADNLADEIRRAVADEKDQAWRYRLLGAVGESRQQVLNEWHEAKT